MCTHNICFFMEKLEKYQYFLVKKKCLIWYFVEDLDWSLHSLSLVRILTGGGGGRGWCLLTFIPTHNSALQCFYFQKVVLDTSFCMETYVVVTH